MICCSRRKKLNKGVLYVHLNLAISLLLALLIFVFGVDLASSEEVKKTGS